MASRYTLLNKRRIFKIGLSVFEFLSRYLMEVFLKQIFVNDHIFLKSVKNCIKATP